MSEDFYCDEVLSGKTEVEKVFETDNILAYHHTRPFWPPHIVVIPKRHIDSLLSLDDPDLLVELFEVIKKVAADVTAEKGSARMLTNLVITRIQNTFTFTSTRASRFRAGTSHRKASLSDTRNW